MVDDSKPGLVDGDEAITKGGCLCGSVTFEVTGPLRGVVNCHCSMCQKLHGSYGPHTKAPGASLRITNDSGLGWYETSEIARRGFCRECGSGLFWEPYAQDGIGIIAGSLDAPTELKTIGHIFVGEKSDFYEIRDDAPQFEGSSSGELSGDFK